MSKIIKEMAIKYANTIAQTEHHKDFCIVDYQAGAEDILKEIEIALHADIGNTPKYVAEDVIPNLLDTIQRLKEN